MSHTPFPRAPLEVALIGAGKVGTAVAETLAAAGHSVVGVASRTEASARRASARLGAPVFHLVEGAPRADLLVLGTPDAVVEPAAEALAGSVAPGAVVCHFAGSLGLAPLEPVALAGGRTAALHPVAACPEIEAARRRLVGCAWGITCGDELRRWVHDLVRDSLGGHPVDVAEPDRAVWHAATVACGNGVAALLALGEEMLSSLGVARPREVLGPLAAGVVANARELPSDEAITGPVVRGDDRTVTRHRAALDAMSPDLGAAYVLSAQLVLLAASGSARIDAPTAERLQRALASR